MTAASEEGTSAGAADCGQRRDRRVPGEPGLWLFLGGDLLLFLILIVVWCVQAHDQPAEFAASRSGLNVVVGAAMTASLLISSYFVAEGVAASRMAKVVPARRYFTCAVGLGLLFVLLKVSEYATRISEGVDTQNNSFGMYYFTVTGIHLLHVIIGLIVLTVVRQRAFQSHHHGTQSIRVVEGGAAYWHVIDVVWIFLFVLIYVL